MRKFWLPMLFMPCSIAFAQTIVITGTTNSLASYIAAVPSGGEIVVTAGTYPVMTTISRTTPIAIKCSAGAVIQSDTVWLQLSGSAAGSSITGCDFEPISIFTTPCTAAQVHAGTCTAVPVTIDRCPEIVDAASVSLCPGGHDTVGYEPSINDADIWDTGSLSCGFPHCLTGPQMAAVTTGPFTQILVDNVTVSNNTGNRVTFGFQGSNETATGNNFVGGAGGLGCIMDAYQNSGQVLTDVNFSNNHIRDCQDSAIVIANTNGARIASNFLDYNGLASVQTYESAPSDFSQYGNINFIVTGNEGSFNYQGGSDFQAVTTGTIPTTNGTISYNNFGYSGIPVNNSIGIISIGNGNTIMGNTTTLNACAGIDHAGDNSIVSGNKIQNNFATGSYSGCNDKVDFNVAGVSVVTYGNNVVATGQYGESHAGCTGCTYVSMGDTVTNRTFNNFDPPLMIEIGDSDSGGPRPNLMGTITSNSLGVVNFPNGLTSGTGFTGTKTAGSCVLTIVSGIVTNVTGC